MSRIEEITRGAVVEGVLPDGSVTFVDVNWIGSAAFVREPDFGVTSVNYKLAELLAKGEVPC